MIGVRRRGGSIDIPADSWGSIEVKADLGEIIKVTGYSASMQADTAGSSVTIKAVNVSYCCIAAKSDSSPTIIPSDLSSVPVVYVDDENGFIFAGINKATAAKQLYYALWGVKL